MDFIFTELQWIVLANIINALGAIASFYTTYLIGADADRRKIFLFGGINSILISIGAILLARWPVLTLNAIWLVISIVGYRGIAINPNITHLRLLLPPIITAGIVFLYLGRLTLAGLCSTSIFIIAYLLLSTSNVTKLWYLICCVFGFMLLTPHLLDVSNYTGIAMEAVSFVMVVIGIYRHIKTVKLI